MPNATYLSCWVTKGSPTVVLGTLPANFFIDKINVHVQTAFNAGTNNNLSIGYTGTAEAYLANISVASTGRKTASLVAGIGLETTARTITAYYTQSGSVATTGKVFIEVYAHQVLATPSA